MPNSSVTNFNVNIPDGATLRYTLNGAAPTAFSAESSDGHFSVGMYGTQTYRFRLFKDGYLPSPVVTRSFINDTKGNNMPVIAVTTADANLNSSSYGIFATYGPNGRPGMGATSNSNRNMDWERPANVEYFDLTGNAGGYECVINQEADIAVAGGWSRKSYTPPPFKIKAAEQYEGVKYLHYPVFKDKPYTKHRTLFMRHEQDLLDVGIQEIARRSGLNIDTQAWEPAELYINGVSKGYVPIREPSNKHFALANYGIDTDLVDVFEVSCDSNYIQSTGTREAFDRWYDLAERCGRDEAAYRELCELVDIDEYLNYMATEFYIFNTDWPWNNVKGFRASDGKFRMILMDIGDQGFAHAGNHASPSESPFEYFRSWKDQHYLGYGETRFVTIFFNMMQHEAIRRQFVDTYCLVAYSVYDPDFITEVMGELVAKCNGWVNDSRIRTTLTPQWQNQEMRHLALLPEAGVSMEHIRSGNMTDQDWEKLVEALGPLSEAPVYIDDTGGITFSEVRSKCRKLKIEHGLDLVMIDYLQLMSGSGRAGDNRQQEISEISRGLKMMARELDVPVIALSQLSRTLEARADHRPMMSDLRESGAIEQDADVIIFLYRDEYYHPDSEDKNIAEIIIGKQRNGPVGTVKLRYDGEYTRFSNLAHMPGQY